MDCCNYMQYRHHQPYYGSQYCDPFPLYHAEFYGHQIYQDYYGNSSYYPPQWPYTASFPDYVYNPKEARIRKAMRDATRERSIGASPMLSRPNTRRASQSWGLPHDDIMMSSLGGVHSSIETTVCGGFELSTPGNNQFMTPMTDSGFTNLEPPTPPPPPPPLPPLPSPISSTNTVHSKYIQPNPLAQLQQHAEMWHDYPTLRPRSSGNPYILPEILSYHSQASESTNNLLEEKISHLQSAGSHPQNHTQSMTHEISRKTRMDFDEKLVVEGSQESSRNHDHSIFETTADMDSRIEQHNDELKIKKDEFQLPISFQKFRSCHNLFSNDLKYQHNYILEYFENLPSMILMNVTTPNGFSFPYATFAPLNIVESVKNDARAFANLTEPNFYNSDVGFIPMSSL